MSKPGPGFREREHTADWELEVWAPNWPALLEQAARGMYQLMGTRLQPEPRLTRQFKLQALDRESVLVAFLSELLYFGEMEAQGFDTFDIKLEADTMQVQLGGAPLASQSKEIKAVTYHNLAILETDRGLEVTIVFDV